MVNKIDRRYPDTEELRAKVNDIIDDIEKIKDTLIIVNNTLKDIYNKVHKDYRE